VRLQTLFCCLSLSLWTIGVSNTLPAQTSHGYTLHKLVDSNSVDVNGAPVSGTPNDDQSYTTDGTNVIFLGRTGYPPINNGLTTTSPFCDPAWTI
jgi:hypothetical protein